jgi:hypothetical protein
VRDNVNGWILENTKCVLGGTDFLEAEIPLANLFDDRVLQSYKMHIQRWPRDKDLKKGLLSGLWKDLKTIVPRGTPPSPTTRGLGFPPVSSSRFWRELTKDMSAWQSDGPLFSETTRSLCCSPAAGTASHGGSPQRQAILQKGIKVIKVRGKT